MKNKIKVTLYRHGIPTGSDTIYAVRNVHPYSDDERIKARLDFVHQYDNVPIRLVKEIEMAVDNYRGPQNNLTRMIEAILRERGKQNQIH